MDSKTGEIERAVRECFRGDYATLHGGYTLNYFLNIRGGLQNAIICVEQLATSTKTLIRWDGSQNVIDLITAHLVINLAIKQNSNNIPQETSKTRTNPYRAST